MGLESTDETAVAEVPIPREAAIDPHAASHAEVGHTHVPTHYRLGTRRSISIFAIAVAIGLLAIFAWIQYSRHVEAAALEAEVHRAATAPPAVDAVRVSLADANGLFTLPGNARSFSEATIFAQISGYVHHWNHDIGDEVKEGELLATIETPELDAQLRAARAKLHVAEAEVKVAESNVVLAQSTYDRFWQSPKGVVSEQEREEKKAERDTSKSKLLAAIAQANSNDEVLNSLMALAKFKEVCAPFHGVITARHTDIGQLVTAGSTTNTPLFGISQADQIRVYVEVPQPVLPMIHEGMRAYAQARELGDRKFVGTVVGMASSLDLQSRTMRVQVLVPNGIRVYPTDFFFQPPAFLHPGMYLTVTFQTDRANPPVRIPPAALSFGPHGARVAVIDGDGRIHFRPITIERDLGDAVEVGSGLKDGETVALNVGSQVVDGEHVDSHVIDAFARAAPPAGAAAVQHPAAEAEAGR